MRRGAQPGCKYGLPKTYLDSIPISRARQQRSLGCWKYNIPDEIIAIPRLGTLKSVPGLDIVMPSQACLDSILIAEAKGRVVP